MFSSRPQMNFGFLGKFSFLAENAFNLEYYGILSFGKVLILWQMTKF